jgi:RalA-binding protein 1
MPLTASAAKGKQRELPIGETEGASPYGQMAPPPPRQLEQRISAQQLRSHSASGPPRAPAGSSTRPPTLSPSLLPYVAVKVMTSSIKSDQRGREVVAFTIAITLQVPPESDPRKLGGTWRWQVEKSYADVLLLDSAVKHKNGRSQTRKVAAVPEKNLFKDNAPSKVDLRKVRAGAVPFTGVLMLIRAQIVTQNYLQSLASVPLQDKADICQFLSSNVVSERNAPVTNPAYKAGHLTKKGRSFGGWQTRYYVLNGPLLDYYENVRGSPLRK